MKSRRWTLIFLALVAGLICFGLSQDDLTAEQSAWLEEAQLGPHQPETEDYDAIYEAAQEEGKVVLLSLSSRFPQLIEEFQAAYPGIEVEASDMNPNEQVDKLVREQQAGLQTIDVLFLSGETALMTELLPQHLIWNYVPSTTYDGKPIDEVIPENFQQPLLTHSLEPKVTFYNFETYPDGSPVDSLWDLTRPEWNGRVQMKDPMLTEENMNVLVMAVKHADEMAAAYEEEFGEPIELSPGVENAGYEWIKRLKENGLVLTSSDGDASDAVGAPGQENPPLTMAVSASKIRDNEEGLKLAVAWDMEPSAGLLKGNYLAIANQAPHPNAAKLLVRFMLGNAEGKGGFAPWHVPGQWAARTDVPIMVDSVTGTGDISLEQLAEDLWQVDSDYIYEHGLQVRDFWLGL